MSPAEKAAAIKQFWLFLFNFEVLPHPLRDFVNPAFHLVDEKTRARIAAGVTARARTEGMDPAEFWQSIIQFWLINPAVIADDAALSIKVHEFHRLLHGSGRPTVTAVVP